MNNEQLIMNNVGMLFYEKRLFDSSTAQQCEPTLLSSYLRDFITIHYSPFTQPQGGC